LRKQFDEARISFGYRCLAELIKQGFFNIIFTTNLDGFLENSLTGDEAETAGFEVLIAGKQRSPEMLELLKSPVPPVKIVKLHGDVQARNFAFTPNEISLFGSETEDVLRHYLTRDLIIVGPGSRDYDLNRALEREGGSIWYIDHSPPTTDTPLLQAMIARSTEANVISGEFGLFDRFFEALYRELM
jgi:hypothetical protein